MEMSTGVSTGTSTLFLVLSEATTELLLMVISIVVWWYFEDLCKLVGKPSSKRNSKAASPIIKQAKQAKCSQNADTELEATSSEHEPEAELFPTQKIEQVLSTTSPAVLESADLSEPESQDKIDGTPQVLQPQPVLFPPPGLELPGSESPDGDKAPKKKKNGKPKSQPSENPRELARCVCWKDSFGFLVDETGSRLFVRTTDVEGDKALLAGQIVLFRRGEVQPRATPKGRDVVLVDIEMAKILRAAEREGMSWSTFMKAVIDDDFKLLSGFKSLQMNASNKSKLLNFRADVLGPGIKDKAEAVKASHGKTKGSHVPGASTKALKETLATAGNDVDLKAFLGSGSIEEMRANLKYAPQWVTDKFNSQHGLGT